MANFKSTHNLQKGNQVVEIKVKVPTSIRKGICVRCAQQCYTFCSHAFVCPFEEYSQIMLRVQRRAIALFSLAVTNCSRQLSPHHNAIEIMQWVLLTGISMLWIYIQNVFFFSNTPSDSNQWGILYPRHVAQNFKGTCIMFGKRKNIMCLKSILCISQQPCCCLTGLTETLPPSSRVTV